MTGHVCRRVWIVLLLAGLLGCSSPDVVEQARLLGTREFSKAAWSKENNEKRAEMVFSFLSLNDAKTLTSSSVKELLGPATGYYNYDENPAYLVGPESVQSEYGKGYLLAFVADKTTGRIVEVKIIPEPK